jgi:Chaperone of endosialidase
MGLFDLFSNVPAQQATTALDTSITQGQQAAASNINAGQNALTQYAGPGGYAANALTSNFGPALQSLTGNYGAASSALNSNYAGGINPLLANFNTANAGTTALGNALGLNGPQGNAAATAAFFASPEIQAQLDVGSQNVERNANALGTLNSGATQAALQNYGQQVASQGWNNYVSNLQPYLNFSQGTGANLAAIYSQLGNQQAGVSTGLGQGQAGLYSNLGTNLANLYGNTGSQLLGSDTNLANLNYGADTSIGAANANQYLSEYNTSAAEWNTILGGVNAAANVAGKFTQSDVRIKDNIEPVGTLYDGLKVYRFNYKGDAHPRIGLMAQEVEQVHPEAVAEIGGIKYVDYDRATRSAADRASRIMQMGT